jgi:putative transposase
VAALVAAISRWCEVIVVRDEHLRQKRLRAPGYDYASPGTYWVTICVHHMERRFGHVDDGEVHLNDAGTMVETAWINLPDRFPGMTLDAYVVMPNHLHGIVMIVGEPRVSLSEAIGAFKSITTVSYARGVRAGQYPAFDRTLWQRGFEDRIVQTDRRLETLRAYVEGNPGRWQEKQDAHR